MSTWWVAARLRTVWHVLRGDSVMFRVIVNYGPADNPRLVLAHYKGSSLTMNECELAGWEPLTGESYETYKESRARASVQPHVDDVNGNRWDTSTW